MSKGNREARGKKLSTIKILFWVEDFFFSTKLDNGFRDLLFLDVEGSLFLSSVF